MRKNKLLLLLVLLMTAATGAWAADAYEEFTTVDPDYAQLEFTGEHIKITGTSICEDGMFVMSDYPVTISALNGKVITKVELTVNLLEEWNNTYAILSTPNATIEGTYADGQKFTITPTGAKASEITLSANVDAEKATFLVKNWKVYYADAGPTTYSITLDEGTGKKDSQNWEIKPKSSELSGGEDVTVKYNGSREVKSVTVVKKAEKAVDNTYLAWDADQKKLVATPMPESFTTVTSEVSEWSAGTYVVEGEVDITTTIELSGDVNLIIKDGAKLTVAHLYGNSHNLSIYGQAQMTGELDVYNSYSDAINEIPTLEVHSAKVTATSSYDYSGGFYEIGTFNVYGGLVDAKGTAADGGYGICLSGDGTMNIYGGEVKAEGKGTDSDSYGITCGESLKTTVKVYGGKLWAGCADNRALDSHITLTIEKSPSFNVEIQTSSDNSTWNPTVGTPDAKYVRVGY